MSSLSYESNRVNMLVGVFFGASVVGLFPQKSSFSGLPLRNVGA